MTNAMSLLLAALLGIGALPASAQDKAPRSRGELLYATYCIGCHGTQVHWRDKRLARDLRGLTEQVRRWQANTGQNWDEADIREVVNHLNRRYYKFGGPTDRG
ncbi:MAG: cytochrome c [Burkholderiales bacterium]|nr:cytochrome c [Burkholderiales bacterium]